MYPPTLFLEIKEYSSQPVRKVGAGLGSVFFLVLLLLLLHLTPACRENIPAPRRLEYILASISVGVELGMVFLLLPPE